MTLVEFAHQFATDAACRGYLHDLRWGKGFHCPRCKGTKGYVRHDRPLVECAGCGYQASATAGTVFHRRKVPLRKWFLALFLNAQSKRGISALELSKQIGVHRETAWTMLHKLRQAMAARDRLYTLGGIVDMDDAFFGGVKHGKAGRGTTRVKAVVAVSMDENNHPRHAKIVVVNSWTQPEMNAVTEAIVEPGSTIRTDAMSGFMALGDAGFERDIIPTVKLAEDVSPFPDVHMLISNAKAWVLGTFHGLGPKYMQTYLAEFIYRFNRRHLEHHVDHTPTITRAAGDGGATAFVERLPDGYETVLGPTFGGRDLSVGRWQRVATSCGLMRFGDLLVLDEPTAALDAKAEADVYRRLVEHADGRTAVLISHRMGFARLADRILVLREGELVEEGTHAELMRQGGEYARLMDAQARWCH